MKIITNYLNSFENYLPEKVKNEVRSELESSILEQIDDKETELGRALNQTEQEKLLIKIGHPMRIAAAYLPNQQLISKDYFPAYKKSLRLSMTIFGLLTVLSIIPFSLLEGSIIGGIIHTCFALLETGVWVFSGVTLIFYFLQKDEVSLDKLYAWSPKQLQYTTTKVSLNRIDIIFEMTFEVIFLVFWNRLFNIEATLIEHELVHNVTMSSEWQSIFIIVNVLVGLSILLSLQKLLVSGWTKIGLIASIVIGAFDLLLIIFIFRFDQFIVIHSTEVGGYDWQQISWTIQLNISIFLGIVASITTWDIYSSMKKLKYQ